jgi:hypothetical protein
MEFNCPSLARQRLAYLNGVHKIIFFLNSQPNGTKYYGEKGQRNEKQRQGAGTTFHHMH